MEKRDNNYGAGSILVGVVFLLFLLSALLGTRYPQFVFLGDILLGGFIGGFTNTIAIKMLFEKRWYLPGSGVLLKSRERIISTLAETVEKHILNTELMEGWLRDKLANLNRDDIRNGLNSVIEEFREDLIAYVKSDEVHKKLIRAAEDVVGKMGFIRHMVRLLTSRHDIVNKVTYYICAKIYELRVSDGLMDTLAEKVGSLEEVLLKPNNPLILKHYNSGESIAGYMLNQLNIKQRVVERLSGYPPHKITRLLEDNIREHLVWLEIFGVILGCLFSGIFGGALYMASTGL